jgi:hypothetical protein
MEHHSNRSATRNVPISLDALSGIRPDLGQMSGSRPITGQADASKLHGEAASVAARSTPEQ